MADLMDEIGDDLRRQQLAEFWKQNGSWIIGGAVMAVVLTAVLAFWRGHEAAQNVLSTQALLSTIETSDAGRLIEFAKTTDKDHAVIARFVAAGLHVRRQETEQAIALYKEIENTSGIGRTWRDLAKLLGVGQQLETGDPATLYGELEDLTDDKNPWRFSALEMQALLYARQGKMDAAAAALTRISGDPAAPQDARTRAFTLRELYLGSVKEATP